MEDFRHFIRMDPAICHGQPCIKGTRILVSVIMDNLAHGMSTEDLIKEYPSLTPEGIRAAMGYAAELTHDSVIALPG